MVEPDNDLIISSEESQTVFEGEQTLMQPPPLELAQQLKQKKARLIGILVVGLFTVLVLAGMYFSGSNEMAQLPTKEEAPPSPTPIFTDQAKEAELQRVEGIVLGVNPETLLLPPPQVDMTVLF